MKRNWKRSSVDVKSGLAVFAPWNVYAPHLKTIHFNHLTESDYLFQFLLPAVEVTPGNQTSSNAFPFTSAYDGKPGVMYLFTLCSVSIKTVVLKAIQRKRLKILSWRHISLSLSLLSRKIISGIFHKEWSPFFFLLGFLTFGTVFEQITMTSFELGRDSRALKNHEKKGRKKKSIWRLVISDLRLWIPS